MLKLFLYLHLIQVPPPATFLQDFKQFLFPQDSQVKMFVNLRLYLTVDSLLILMKPSNGLQVTI